MAPWSMSAKLESTWAKVAAAAAEPYWSTPMRADTRKMTPVFSLASQATMMPVQPTSSVMAVDRMPAVPTLKAAPRPMRQAERNTVRRTMVFTFMPA